jgi:hypothetical protein
MRAAQGETLKADRAESTIPEKARRPKHTVPTLAWKKSDLPGIDDRMRQGRVQRQAYPRAALAQYEQPSGERDPIAILQAESAGRLRDLVPVRHGRMLPSPFAFLRGAAAVMSADIGALGATGIRTQLCGDCHLRNFGGFAGPDRRLLFGINDFDQTLPGPFEWDVKRLATSTSWPRGTHASPKDCREAAVAAARSIGSGSPTFRR